MSSDELKDTWRTLFGTDPPAYNKPYLVKRLAYRLQELKHGGLSEAARDKMKAVLKEGDFDGNGRPPGPRKRDGTTPVTGTRLVREWNGRRYEVTVAGEGFEYEGKLYRSLTGVTKAITGAHWNGPAFFGLRRKPSAKGGAAR
ncbi:MAG: DUF2924 domain-containing protein [Planctomycetota bacterium]|jgi:hypothetical protein